jgi:MFS family permease
MATLLLIIIYVSFISLGLPDGMLGAAWPVMRLEFAVPLGSAGIISMIISLGTVVSSLFSAKLIKKFGTGMISLVSVFLTALALLLFSFAQSLYPLFLFASSTCTLQSAFSEKSK